MSTFLLVKCNYLEEGLAFGEGHIDPQAFRQACLVYSQENFGEDQAEEDAREFLPEDVTHEWWFQPDPEDDETLRSCDESHPGAMPFTAWRR